jgi:hypothetical protein
MHLFGHNFDHDYYFELPRKGERDAQSITRLFRDVSQPSPIPTRIQ